MIWTDRDWQERRFTEEQLVLLDGRKVICPGCANDVIIPDHHELMNVCSCGTMVGTDADGHDYYWPKSGAQAVWDFNPFNPQN